MSAAGQAVRETRVIRATGLPAQVVDTHHPETPLEPGPGRDPARRFGTWCPTHENGRRYSTWKEARRALASPEDWCQACAELVAAEGPVAPRNGGFSEEERERARAVRSAHAAKRREEEERRRAARDAERDAERAWSDWCMGMPMVTPAYEADERERMDELRTRRLAEADRARRAKAEVREAEAELDPPPGKPMPKPKRKKELEERIREAESVEQTATDLAAQLQTEQNHLHRVAFLRACQKAGWRIHRNGTGTDLRQGDEALRLPPDYLPAELLANG